MSDLQVENDQLKKQLAQNSQGVEGLLAQLEAHRGTVNDLMQQNLNLRTNFSLLQKQAQLLDKQLKEAQTQVKALEDAQAPKPE